MTLDITKAADQVPASIRQSYEQSVKQLGATTIPADVWVDGDGLVRKIAFSFSIPKTRTGGMPGGGQTITETIEFFDFGVNVDVTPPPASETTDLTKLMGGLAKGLGKSGG